MALQVRGIEYRVNVKVGRSSAGISSLSSALSKLNVQLTAVKRNFSVLSTLQKIFVGVTNRLNEGALTLNGVLKGQVNVVDRLSKAKARAEKISFKMYAAQRFGFVAMNKVVGSAKRLTGATRQLAAAQAHAAKVAFRMYAAQRHGFVSLNAVTASAKRLASQQKSSNILITQGDRGVRRMTGGFMELQAALFGVAAVFASIPMVGFIKNSTLLAGRVQNLQTVMEQVGRTANVSRGEMRATENQMRLLGITTRVSREILTRFAQNNLRVADSLRISRIAQDAAVVAGLNSSETAERMMIAVQRLDTRMLRNLGILINLRNEYQRVAIATGRYENSLTANEKQQIVLNAVMRAGVALSGAYERSLQDVYKQYTSLERKVEEARREIGENFMPVFKLMVQVTDSLADSIGGLGKKVGGLADSIAQLSGVLLGGGLAIGIGLLIRLIGVAAAAFGAYGLIIIGLGAAIGGLIASISSLVSKSERMKKSMQENADVQVHQRIRIRELADEVERLGNIQNRTAEETNDLAAAKVELLSLLTKEERAIIAATDSLQEFIATARAFERLGLSVSAPDDAVIGKQRAVLDYLVKKQEELRSMAENAGPFWNFLFGYSRLVGIIGDKIDEVKGRLKSLGDDPLEKSLRALSDLATATDNVNQQAIKARKALSEMAEAGLASEHSNDILKLLDILKTLNVAQLDRLDIEKQYQDQMKKQSRLFAENKAALEEKYEGDKLAIELQDLKLDRDRAEADLLLKKDQALQELEDRMKTVAVATSQLHDRLEEAATAHAIHLRQLRLSKLGLSDFASALDAVPELYRHHSEAVNGLSEKLKVLQDEYVGIQEALRKGEEVQKADARLAGLRDQIDAYKKLIELERQAVPDKLLSAYAKMAETLGVDTAAIREMTRELSNLRMENELLAAGTPEDIVAKILGGAESADKFEDEVAKLLAIQDELHIEWLAAREKLRVALTKEDKEIAEAQLKSVEDLQKSLMDKARLLYEQRLEQEKKFQGELTDTQKKAAEEQAKNEETLFKKFADDLQKQMDDALKTVEDITKRAIDATRKTDEALFKLRLERGDFGKDKDRRKAAFDMFQEFRGLLEGAGSADQVKVIQKEFEKSFAKTFGVVGRDRRGNITGPNADAYKWLVDSLNQIRVGKVQALDKQQEQLKGAAKNLDEAAAKASVFSKAFEKGKDKVQSILALTPGALGAESARMQQEKRNAQLEEIRKIPDRRERNKKLREFRKQRDVPIFDFDTPLTAGLSAGFSKFLEMATKGHEEVSKMGEELGDAAEKSAKAIEANRKVNRKAAEQAKKANKRYEETTRKAGEDLKAAGLN